MIYIYNRDEEQIDILDIKPKFTREIGKFNTLEFETIKEYEKGYRVVYQYKGKPYEFIIQEQDYLRDDMVSFSYFCKDSFVENEGVPILDKRPEGSYKVALNSVLEDTRWEFIAGSDFSETLTFFNSFYQVSVLEAFAEIVGKYNLEFETSFTFTGSKITSRKIHIKKLGEKANSRLEFGKNIVKFERKILSENIVTALYGHGKGEETETGGYGRRISFADINGGLAYVTNEEARLKYGIGPTGSKEHLFGFFIDEEETDKAKLLESTRKELERVSQVQAEYTIEAVNLHIDCDYADTVPVLDEEINFSGETRIVKAIVEGDDLVFVFGHVVKGFTDSFTKEIQKSAEATEIKITSIMETRLNQIADVYFGEDGYNYDLKVGNEYGLPAGLYSFDTPIDENPTKVIYFGAGKLLIADRKATDGGWTWKTALDGQGIVGSSIVAHSITANKLAADVGQSLDLSSNVSITQTVKSETQSYIDENKDQLKGADGISSHIWIRYYSGDLHPLDEWDFSKFTVYPTELTKWVGVMVNPYEDTYAIGDFAIEFFTWTKFVGSDGKDGATPYIGSNGNWWINGIDTGVEADVAPIREEFESYRTQTDKAIEDRVTKTEYSGLTTRVAQAEQKLTPTSITQTVENNTTTLATKAEVQTTAENWTAKFSQIGGRNFLLNSKKNLTNNTYKHSDYYFGTENPKAGDIYTATVKFSLGSDRTQLGLYTSNGYTPQVVFSNADRNSDGVASKTFTLSYSSGRTPADGFNYISFYQLPSSGTSNSTIEWVKLEKGSVATDWTPAPEELYTGITTINKDGVTVGREGETIQTNLGFDGLRIKDGSTEIASFAGSGAVINNLEAESISGDVINIMSSSMTFDIGSETGYYADFSEVLNAIGNRKHLANGVKITINIRSVLNETISIEGFSGGGSIEVNIYSRVNGFIRTRSNSCVITVYGKNTTHVVSASGNAITSSADAYVLFDGLNIDAKDTTNGRGISSLDGSNVYVHKCDMTNCQTALFTGTAGKLYAVDTKGNVSRYAALGYGGSIWLGGTIPDGDTSWFVYTFGNVTRTPSAFSPPATKTVTETRTFNHTDIYTYSVQYGAKSTHYGKAAAQNRWDTSMTQMKGRISFGSSVYSFISGRNRGTTPTVKIRLRRQNSSHGASASVKPTPDWSGAPSFGGATRGNWTPWVTIPYSLFTSSGYTFSFYNGTTGSSYAIWDRAEIQITRTVTQ